MGGRARVWLTLVATAAVGACELQEVSVVDVEQLVIAEVYVTVGEVPADHRVTAFLHGTGSSGAPDRRTFDDATVTVARSDGLVMALGVVPIADCFGTLPDSVTTPRC